MKSHLSLAFAVLFLSVRLHAQEPVSSPATTDTLKVACWNVLNLFDNSDDIYKLDEDTEPKSIADINATARLLGSIDADVVAMIEVENRGILERLNLCLKSPYAYVDLLEGNDPRGIDVGVLSRFPIVRSTSHRLASLEKNLRFSRDFPLFRIQLAPDRCVDVGPVHLKSKRGEKAESDAWRNAEAKAIRSILEAQRKLEPTVPVIVCGDFNDARDAATLAPLFEFLVDTTTLVPEPERFSYVYQGKGEQIDFILASADLPPKASGILHVESNPSDHAPVWTEFKVDRKLDRIRLEAGHELVADPRPHFKATDLEGLTKKLLSEVTIEGQVVQIHKPRGGSVSLNFAEDYKKAITVYVPAEAVARIGKLDDLKGKVVSVHGPVSRYRDQLQIKVTRPEQIEVK